MYIIPRRGAVSHKWLASLKTGCLAEDPSLWENGENVLRSLPDQQTKQGNALEWQPESENKQEKLAFKIQAHLPGLKWPLLANLSRRRYI